MRAMDVRNKIIMRWLFVLGSCVAANITLKNAPKKTLNLVQTLA